MKAKLSLFIALILFILSLATIAKGATSTIQLQVAVLPNIVSYFDGKNIIVKTNNSEPIVVIKDDNNVLQQKNQIIAESGSLYTIVPAL